MSRSIRFRLAIALLILLPMALFAADVLLKPVDKAETSAKVKHKIDFAKQIEPLLRSRCYSCHGDETEGGTPT